MKTDLTEPMTETDNDATDDDESDSEEDFSTNEDELIRASAEPQPYLAPV
jgi:hypothetical protein